MTGGGEFESEVRSQLANYPNQANQPIFDRIEVDHIEHFYKADKFCASVVFHGLSLVLIIVSKYPGESKLSYS